MTCMFPRQYFLPWRCATWPPSSGPPKCQQTAAGWAQGRTQCEGWGDNCYTRPVSAAPRFCHFHMYCIRTGVSTDWMSDMLSTTQHTFVFIYRRLCNNAPEDNVMNRPVWQPLVREVPKWCDREVRHSGCVQWPRCCQRRRCRCVINTRDTVSTMIVGLL